MRRSSERHGRNSQKQTTESQGKEKQDPRQKPSIPFASLLNFVFRVWVWVPAIVYQPTRERKPKREREKKRGRDAMRERARRLLLLSQRQISILSFFKKYRTQAPTTTTTTTRPFTHHAPHAQRRRGGTGDREQRARRSQKEARTWARTHTKNLAFPFSTHREQRGYKREKSA